MRSFDRAMPEELNRVLTDHASDLLLCSTETAVGNLEREGARGEVAPRGRRDGRRLAAFRDIAEERSRILTELGSSPAPTSLVTAHRAGNVDDRPPGSSGSSSCWALPSRCLPAAPAHARGSRRPG